jgi:hypothetical protein
MVPQRGFEPLTHALRRGFRWFLKIVEEQTLRTISRLSICFHHVLPLLPNTTQYDLLSPTFNAFALISAGNLAARTGERSSFAHLTDEALWR